jgi:4-amino-4-deoxy-L-arabinose transferase-like glycosyltransferase
MKYFTKERLLLLLILILAIFNCFYKISSNEIAVWDEARRGVAAFEMLNNNEYIVNTYLNQPDYWSVKPPAGLWLIAASYKTFKPSIFALRFPSALCAVLTVILVYLLAAFKYSKKAGLAAAAILCTIFPFIFDHSARAGEYDAPLALIITMIVSSLLIITKPSKLTVILGFLFALAFLLKSFAFFIPLGIFLSWLISKDRLKNWEFKHTLEVSIIFLALISCWMVLRYQVDGLEFLGKMLSTDLQSRTLSAIEGHKEGILFYPLRILSKSIWWTAFAVLIGIILLRNRSQNQGKIGLTIFSWVLMPLIAATIVSTKLSWYINPLYPAIAVVLGEYAIRAAKFHPRLVCSCFFIAFLCGELRVIDKIYKREKLPDDQIVLRQIENSDGERIFALNWTQAQQFIAIVEKNLAVNTAESLQDFKTRAAPGDMFYSPVKLDESKLKPLHQMGTQVVYQYIREK